MGYDFQIKGYYTVKEDKEYPWPCKSEPDRKIKLFADDILTKTIGKMAFTKHTGLCCFNIRIPEGDLVYHKGKTANLRLL